MKANDQKPVLRQDEENGLVVITLNRPDKRNCLSLELLDSLLFQLRDFLAWGSPPVILIKGAGNFFCSGLDLRDATTGSPVNEKPRAKTMAGKVQEVLYTIQSLASVVIVQAERGAVGGGAALVAVSDFALVDESFQITFPETKLVLAPYLLHPFLKRILTPKAMAEALFLGNPISAQDALRFGLVSRIVPRWNLDNEARSLAAHLLSLDPEAVRQTKQATQDRIPSLDELKNALDEHWNSWNTPVVQSKINAFLQKGHS